MNLNELLATLDAPIVVRPVRRMTQGELESYLDKAADILRGNADHSEFRGYVFALLFYKRINDCFEEEVRTQAAILRAAQVAEPEAEHLARQPELHHFVVPEAADWATVARTAKAQLGQALNDAMLAIERANAHRQKISTASSPARSISTSKTNCPATSWSTSSTTSAARSSTAPTSPTIFSAMPTST